MNNQYFASNYAYPSFQPYKDNMMEKESRFVLADEGFKKGNLDKTIYKPYRNYNVLCPKAYTEKEQLLLNVQKNSFAQYFIHDYWGKYSNLKKIEVPVTEITFDNTYIELELGKSSTIKVSISPDNATIPNLIWESSNPSIVSINQSGSITAKSVGTATITVKANDGSNTSASCEVKVYSHNVESISLSNYEAVMAINDKITLTYTISPT